MKQQTSEYSELTAMFKKPGSDDLSFVPFCIILLEAAIENGYAVINDAWCTNGPKVRQEFFYISFQTFCF